MAEKEETLLERLGEDIVPQIYCWTKGISRSPFLRSEVEGYIDEVYASLAKADMKLVRCGV